MGGDAMFWTVVAVSAGVAVLIACAAIYSAKHKPTPVEKKQDELDALKAAQEKLEKEAGEIENQKTFDNVNDAIKYLNDNVRKRL